MKKLCAIYLMLLLFSTASSSGQSLSLKFRSYTTNEGLSQGTIFSMAQDKQGFIWLGTADGLNRFDGYNFRVYKDSLVSPSIRKMIAGPDDKIYLGTPQHQIASFDLVQEKYKLLLTNPNDPVSDSRPSFIDAQNNLLFTNDSSIYKYNISSGLLAKKSFPGTVIYSTYCNQEIYVVQYRGRIAVLDPVTLEVKREMPISPGKNIIVAYSYADTDSSLWVSGHTGDFYNIDLISSKIKSYEIPASTDPVAALCFLRKGDRLYMGTEKKGLLVFDIKKEVFLSLNSGSNPSEQILGGRISALFLDKTDNLWVASDPYGVSIADLKEPKFKKINTSEGPGFTLRNNFVKAVFKDSTHFYSGYYRDGFDKIELTTGKTESFKKSGKTGALLDDVVLAIEKDKYNNLWIGTEGGLQKLSANSNVFENYSIPNDVLRVDFIKALPDGDILISLHKNMGIFIRKGNQYRFRLIPEFDNSWITHLHAGPSGKIWASGQKGLFSVTLEKKDNFYSYKVKKELMQYGRIKASFEKKADEVWVATLTGLVKYDPLTNTSKRYNEKDGMANSFVYGLFPDKFGRIWMSTNKGLACFDPKKETFRNYTEQDGLQGNEFNTNVFALQPDGEMIFGGLGGFNYFYPEQVTDNLFAPQASLTSIKLFDEFMALDTSIEYKKYLALPYYSNTLSFEFSGLEYTSPDQNQYAYQMQGVDRDWVYCGKKRFARYAGLSPGNYIFRVKASNSDGIWADKPVELHIAITPPFWRTTAFILLLASTLVILSYISIRIYTRRQLRIQLREAELEQNARLNAIVETEDKERKRIASELHDGLGQMLSTARLNVSGLQGISSDEDQVLVKKSLKIIDDACEEVRHISHNMMPGALIQMGLIPALEDLFDNINSSKLLQIHFTHNLEAPIGESKEITVYRIVQEILNNTIKHAKATNVHISILKNNNILELEIKDDGIGFSTGTIKESTGIGWKNIYSRVSMLNGNIQVDSAGGMGTRVNIQLEYKS